MTTRLFESPDDLVQMLGQITEGRLSDNDRILLWNVVEKQFAALVEAGADWLIDTSEKRPSDRLRERLVSAVGSLFAPLLRGKSRE